MRSMMLTAVLAAFAALSCSVDDSVVEGKHCYVGGGDPDKACMSGYECKCSNGECLCVKIQSLVQPLEERCEATTLSRGDPSIALLRRLGLSLP